MPLEVNIGRYATFIRFRRPEFKIHNGIGHAKNAVNNAGYGYVFERTGDRWFCIHERNGNYSPDNPFYNVNAHREAEISEEVENFLKR